MEQPGIQEVDALNKKIGSEYMTLDGHKIFRLGWSESLFENRHGTFREFTEGGQFLREITETRRVRKYNYIHNRWIFEMWAPGNLVANPETPDAINGDYVPIYVFEDRHGGYLPPNEKVVRFIIAALHRKVRQDEIPSQEYLDQREIEHQVEMMDDHPSWFQTRPGAARNAIWYSGGVPEWGHRRSAFVNAADVNMVERKALIDARLREQARDDRMELEREQIRESVRQGMRRSDEALERDRVARNIEREKTARNAAKEERERLAQEKAAEAVNPARIEALRQQEQRRLELERLKAGKNQEAQNVIADAQRRMKNLQ